MNPHTQHQGSTTLPRAYVIEHRTTSQHHSVGERETILREHIEIGRDARCQIRFDESFTSVSRRHAAIVREDEGWKLVRLSRIRQMLVNGRVISSQWYLQDGDEIQLSVDGPRLGFFVPEADAPVVPPPPPKLSKPVEPPKDVEPVELRQPNKSRESRTLYIVEQIDTMGRRLAASFQHTTWIIACSLIVLVAALAVWAIADWNKSESFMDATRRDVAGVRNSLEAVGSDLSAVRTDLDEVKRRQYELARLINRSDDNLARWLNNNTRDIRLHIAQSEDRLTSDIASMNRNLQPRQRTPVRTPPAQTNPPPRTESAADRREPEKPEEPPSVFAPCFPHIYYIRLDKIEMYGPKNDFRVFNTTQTSWAGAGFLLSDGRFFTARSVVERWKFREYKELSELNALAEKGGRVVAYFTATSPSGSVLTFTGHLFVADKSADAYDNSIKQTFAPSSPDKDVACLQLKATAGLQASRTVPGKNIPLTAYGFPSQIGVNPAEGLLDGGDGFLQIGAGSPVFAVNNSGKAVVVGLLAVSSADGQRTVVPLPQPK